jgi:hypothetical protein
MCPRVGAVSNRHLSFRLHPFGQQLRRPCTLGPAEFMAVEPGQGNRFLQLVVALPPKKALQLTCQLVTQLSLVVRRH